MFTEDFEHSGGSDLQEERPSTTEFENEFEAIDDRIWPFGGRHRDQVSRLILGQGSQATVVKMLKKSESAVSSVWHHSSRS